MRIHYFQRYHQKENVATANTMLLLSRLYQDSPDKFFAMLSGLVGIDEFEPGIVFTIQEKDEKSVPDAAISQDSFKVAVETKLGAGSTRTSCSTIVRPFRGTGLGCF